MKTTLRTAAIALALTALAAVTSLPSVQAASIKKPGKPGVQSGQMNPVPTCAPTDPNGCGIYR